jgi:hypothetical protein
VLPWGIGALIHFSVFRFPDPTIPYVKNEETIGSHKTLMIGRRIVHSLWKVILQCLKFLYPQD